MATAEDERYVERAIELAREAADRGNHPFGSLLVLDGEVIAEDRNTVETDDDITAHPELKLARWAARELSTEECARTTMYTSTMACAMCQGAMYLSHLGRVVYSVTPATAAEEMPGDPDVATADILAGSGRCEVVGPVLEAEGRRVHRECW